MKAGRTDLTKKKTYRMLGLMSGTSLDGLDVAYCSFTYDQANHSWKFFLHEAVTYPYPARWKNALSGAHLYPGAELIALHHAYGKWLGEKVNAFLKKHRRSRPEAIASHGHTIFHQPDKGFTFQLGDGNALHAATGLPVISDFRSLDVALGGEGAPLVPVGDRYLFGDYDYCLNLGGIANISMEHAGVRRAFDICFCNMGFNLLAGEAGRAYDARGRMASSGTIYKKLLDQLNKVYGRYRKRRPSLGREIFERDFKSLLTNREIPLADRMRTFSESVALEIERVISKKRARMLVTGGGALNVFLMGRLQEILNQIKIVVPNTRILGFKEAIVFAFLGVLHIRGEVNVLSSVTKAKMDSCSGVRVC
ncbi:MAG: anhydro-N-acetylmuramic acid kinase [Bacteroidetes bacterium]|nr:anhydro-N-acetylmuramic acid kinase [Bacteroidota bacterium]